MSANARNTYKLLAINCSYNCLPLASHLILETDSGPLAFVLLVLSNGVVFAGVQFGIAVMRLADDDRGPKGGRGVPLATRNPIRVEATAARPKARQRRQAL